MTKYGSMKIDPQAAKWLVRAEERPTTRTQRHPQNERGRLAALRGESRYYGAHFGMRSSRALCMKEFFAGYDEAATWADADDDDYDCDAEAEYNADPERRALSRIA